jgi:hypothetical protein
MKKVFFLLLLSTVFSLNAIAQKKSSKQKKSMASELRHVVMFGFTASTTPEKIKEIETAFAALPKKVKEIKSFEWGTNNSPENLNQGLTHCFLVTFRSEADRDIYIPHPEHKAFVALLDGHIEKVTVLDYWSKK